MSLQSLKPSKSVIDFERFTVLIVEDNQAMRESMKSMLSAFGITRIDIAQRAAEARKKITARQFDIILCDYMLDPDGMTGQELLEELRIAKQISAETIYIMTTAERIYEKVVAAAEYGPDDYIIKPFSQDVLLARMHRAIERKSALSPIFQSIDKRDLESAVAGCDAGIKMNPRFVVDFLRLKAELLLQQDRHEEAQKLYDDILAHKAVPWAKFGMAQIFQSTHQLEAAEGVLKDLVKDNPHFLRAYDTLAQVQRENGDPEAAQATLQRAVDKSLSIARVLDIGELAKENGDLQTAEIMFSKAVSRAGISELIKADHVLGLAAVKSEMGKHEEALSVLTQGKRSLHSAEMNITAAIVEARIYAEKGNHEHARKMLDQALALMKKDGVGISSELAPEVIKACLLLDHPETVALAQSVLEQHSDEKLRQNIENLFMRNGKSDVFNQAFQGAVAVVTKINNDGVQAASRGDFKNAIGLMTEAYHRMPANNRVAINLSKILIAALEKVGFNQDYATQVENILTNIGTTKDAQIRQQVQIVKQKLIQILNRQGKAWRN